jgi:hypothetical protein
MKKLILFVFVLVVGNVRGQTYYPCSVLPVEIQHWCESQIYIDTLNIAEEIDLIVIDTSNSCSLWNIGHSYKTVFDSISSPFGLVTDTLLPYGANLKCSFIVKSKQHFSTSLLFFEHKYETDSLFDGGYIEFSCDLGENWRPIINADWQPWGAPEEINYYNYLGLPDSYYNQTMPSLHDSVPSFTGKNNAWQWSGFQLIWYRPSIQPDENRWDECGNFSDTIYYRFTFESDSIDNSKGGWMIKNIVIGSTDQPSSIFEFSSLPLKLFPNPATEKIAIELPPNSGKLSSILISDIAGNVALRATEAGEIDVSTLSPGIYFVLAETDKFVFRQKMVKQ